MHALECMGRINVIAEDSNCLWPEPTTRECDKCHMWETCDGRNNHSYSVHNNKQCFQLVVTLFASKSFFQARPTSVVVRILQIAWTRDPTCVSVLGIMCRQQMRPWANVKQDYGDAKEKRCQLWASCLALPEQWRGFEDLMRIWPHDPLFTFLDLIIICSTSHSFPEDYCRVMAIASAHIKWTVLYMYDVIQLYVEFL